MDVRSREVELRALMIAGLDGDATAHTSLLTRLSAYLRGYFRGHLARIGRGSVEADDLVQEVLIAIHTRRETYDRAQPFTPWVYAIARYKFADHLRRSKASLRDVPIEEAEGCHAGVSAPLAGADYDRRVRDRLLRIGIVGTLVAAVCCFTPVLVVLLAAVGFSALVGWLDYVLLPAMAIFAALTIYALMRRHRT